MADSVDGLVERAVGLEELTRETSMAAAGENVGWPARAGSTACRNVEMGRH
jgi:hypothetical protein